MKLRVSFFSALLFAVPAFANLGGVNYNVGTYACESRDEDIQSFFTFATRGKPVTQGSFTIKGADVEMECFGPQEASSADLQLFRALGTPPNVCVGTYSKGRVVAGPRNAMGAVLMEVFLVGDDGAVKAKTRLQCKSAKAKEDSPW